MEIKQKDEFKVAGLQITTTVQECSSNNPHPKLWKDFLARIEEIRNRVGNKFYGVCKEISKHHCNFTSSACVEVNDLDNLPEGFVGMTIPKSRYAVFTHKGKVENLAETYRKIHEEEMPKSGLKQKEIWLEVYDERFKENSDDSIMEIWASIE